MLKEFQNEHSNKNIIAIVLNEFFIYVIYNKLSYFIMNNVLNNDIMMKIIMKNFQKMNEICYDLIEHHLHCIDYIINFSV